MRKKRNIERSLKLAKEVSHHKYSSANTPIDPWSQEIAQPSNTQHENWATTSGHSRQWSTSGHSGQWTTYGHSTQWATSGHSGQWEKTSGHSSSTDLSAMINHVSKIQIWSLCESLLFSFCAKTK